MKKMVLLPILAILSMILVSAVLPVFAQTLADTITFTGKIAVSRVEGVIQWRIVIDGSITIDGQTYTGQHTVCKLWASGDIIHVVPDLFL